MDIYTTEQTILGSCLEKPKLISEFTDLLPEYFSCFPYQELWRLLLDWYWRGKTIYPPAILPSALGWFAGEDRQLEASQFLSGLVMMAYPIKKSDCQDYVAQLTSSFLGKQADILVKQTLNDLQNKEDPSTVIDNLQNALFSLRGVMKRNADIESIGSIAEQSLRALDEQIKGIAPKALSTGFRELDEVCGGGLHKGGLVMIGGATGMGKTVMALTLAWNMVTTGGRCLYFNLEMKSIDMARRLISAHAEILASDIRKGNLSSAEFEAYFDTVELMKTLPMDVVSKSDLGIDDILMTIKQQHHAKRLDVVVIDYIQIVRSTERRERRDQELSSMTVALSNLAKELNISIIALAQLNEDVSKREYNRPTLSDIRESKSMGHSCENVWLLFREEYYYDKKKPSEANFNEFLDWQNKVDLIRGKAEIIVAKNRHGQATSIPIGFDGRFVKFKDTEY